jgi:hypothetical protein
MQHYKPVGTAIPMSGEKIKNFYFLLENIIFVTLFIGALS